MHAWVPLTNPIRTLNSLSSFSSHTLSAPFVTMGSAPTSSGPICSGPIIPSNSFGPTWIHLVVCLFLFLTDTSGLENANQLQGEKNNREVRRTPSFSGPLMLPTRASANSLSAPIKSSGGFRDSLDDKSKANLVQIKGRFSVTSENLDLVKGSSLQKSASVGDWMPDSKQMPIVQATKDSTANNISASLIFTRLQNLFQQTSIQQDLIMNMLNSLQPAEAFDVSQNGKLPPLPRGSEINGSVDTTASERERLLLVKILELQAQMINLTDELTAERLKYMQLQQQQTGFNSQQQNGDRKEEVA